MSIYSENVEQYWELGWRGLLPLPVGDKKPVPRGFTGGGGADTGWADIQCWLETGTFKARDDEGKLVDIVIGNIGLRLPRGVVGIDVDCYGGKTGAGCLAEAERHWGELPPTWSSTSRGGDQPSRIRLFRAADVEGRNYIGKIEFKELGFGDVEIIQHDHRYVAAWPSVHPEGNVYRWYRPDGTESPTPPRPEDLAELPARWVEELSKDKAARVDVADFRAELDVWITDGEPGVKVSQRLADALDSLAGAGSRYEGVRDDVAALVRLGEQGEPGVGRALDSLRSAYVQAVTAVDGKRTRSVSEAETEFDRLLYSEGLVEIIAADPTPRLVHDELQGLEDTPIDKGTSTVWGKVDLTEVLADDYTPPETTMLMRSDGIGLLYPGRVHALIGEPEVGKSWIALAAVAEQLDLGHRVLFLDYESTAGEVAGRLQAMGVPKGAILELLDYRNPETQPSSADLTALYADTYALAVVDGITACFATWGFKGNDNDDAADWIKLFAAPLARRTGAAVVTTDHVTKAKDSRSRYALGAQAKLALADVAYLVGSDDRFAPGRTAVLDMAISKDRAGYVRGNSPVVAGEEFQPAASVVLVSGPDGEVSVKVEPPRLQQKVDAVSEMADLLDREGCPIGYGRRKLVTWMKARGMATRSNTFMQNVAGLRNARAGVVTLDDE